MLKKTLIAVSLGILAFGLGRPAAAQNTFLDEYGLISGARPAQGVRDANTPRNALQGQEAEGASKTTFIAGGFFGQQDFGPGDVTRWGGGLGLIGAQNPDHPWQLTASFFNTNLDAGGFDDDFFGWSVGGKYVITLPKSGREPVVSVVGTYSDVSDVGESLFFGLAVDQKVTPSLYLTGNLGWLHAENGGDENDLYGGLGATLTTGRAPRLSLSADWQFENDVTGRELWTVSALYAVNNNVAVRLGGGKDNLFFGNIYLKRSK
ncbi:MAG: hypothetical protein K0Q72_2079 [Armatimonadetes bacterium]|jgi:hypothetical protein|nr:hypothetical protein [Armatimonadota bacterium]